MTGASITGAGPNGHSETEGDVADSDAPTPELSIVVATIRGLPYVEWCLAALRREAEDVGAELIVADGSGNDPAPPTDRAGSRLDADRSSADPGRGRAAERWLSLPGLSVAELRQTAYEQSTGRVIAITEDHCEVEPGWARAMLAVHADEPDVAAVGGAVLNASTDRLIDWGSFYVGQFPFMPPFGRHEARQIASPANASYKRRALDRLSRFRGVGAVEILDNPMLHAAGERLLVDDRIRVRHRQGYSFLETSRLHFHSGRVYAGARRQRMDREAWLRGAAVLILPMPRLAVRALRLPRKEQGTAALPSLPMIAWVLYVQAIGELVGLAAGPGGSARKLL